MPDQLLPPADQFHALPDHLTMDERVAAYVDLLEASEQMLIAGLRSTLGQGRAVPEDELREAVRQVYERQSEDHYLSLVRLAERLNKLEAGHGGPCRS